LLCCWRKKTNGAAFPNEALITKVIGFFSIVALPICWNSCEFALYRIGMCRRFLVVVGVAIGDADFCWFLRSLMKLILGEDGPDAAAAAVALRNISFQGTVKFAIRLAWWPSSIFWFAMIIGLFFGCDLRDIVAEWCLSDG
jgi:hypothetical protein